MARISSALGLVALLPFLTNARTIQFGSQCLGVHSPANDAPTVLVSCSDASAKVDWTYTQPGDNQVVQLTGTNFCLDAGTNPHNNGPAKVYTCYPGTAAQHWYFTGDKRLAITGGSQCLDLSTSSGAPQTYVCTPGNTNQVWTPGGTPTATTTTASITPAPTPTPTVVQYIHSGNADQTRCLTYAGVYDGAAVDVGACGAASEFFVAHGDNVGIYVPGTNLCLTTFNGGDIGNRLVVAYCRQDLNTHFYYTNDQRLAVTGGDTCLDYGDDVKAGAGTLLRFEPCGTGNTAQVFALEDVPATVTSTTAFPDPTTICHTGSPNLLQPKQYANITQQYPSGKIPFQYCSPAYFNLISLNVTVFLASADSADPAKKGVVVGTSTHNASEYDLTLVVPKGYKPAAQSELFVLEWLASDDGSEPFTTTWTQDIAF